MKIKLGKYILIIFLRTNKYKSKLDKDRLRRHQQKRRRLGICLVCGVRVIRKNKRTKKLYRKCETHRKRENDLAKIRLSK